MSFTGEGQGSTNVHSSRRQDGVLPCIVVFLSVLLAALSPGFARAQQGLCATVSIQIQQKVSLERQAFTAELDINNGLTDSSLTGVGVNILFTDTSGGSIVATTDPNNTNAQFFLRQDTLSGINATDGSGTIAPSSNAVMRWLIIPAPGTGGTAPSGAVYFVGASLTYTLGDQTQTVSVNPASITVVPQPQLHLDYFLPNYVYADDPFTPAIEPPVPFTLGVRVTNVGAGAAHALTIESAQPKIIDNQQGLLIGFQLIDSYVDDQPAANTLLINFGDVAPQQSRIGRWDMVTTLSGQFVDFSANFTHADSLGGALTSFIPPGGVVTHTLIHDVLVDLQGRDGVLDFLALDGDIERVYESDNVVDPVVDMSSGAVVAAAGGGLYNVTFTATSSLVYAQVPDPFNGQVAAVAALRSDGKALPAANVWFSKTKNGGGSWMYWVNLFDSSSTGHYTLNGRAGVASSSLSGVVFADVDSSGSLDAGEAGIAGVGVHLHGMTFSGTVDFDAQSDSGGNFHFGNLDAGTYTATVVPVAAYADGFAVAGSAGGSTSLGSVDGIALQAGTVATGYQFAKVPQTVQAIADFALTGFSLSAGSVLVGNTVTLTATLTNLGPSSDSASVPFVVPAGLAIAGNGASMGVFDPTSRIWQVGTMANGASATLTLTMQAKAAGTLTISAAAVAGPAATDPSALNNSASASLAVNSASSFTIAKAGPATAVTKGSLVYTIGLGNSGQGTSGTIATVADVLPSGVSFTGVAPGPGVAGVVCTGTTNLVCSVTLASGLAASSPNGTASFVINTTAPDTAGTITNFASVDASGGLSPPVPGPACTTASCASATTTVNTSATFTLSKAGPSNVLGGATAAYTISIGNSGQVVSGTSMTVADILPTGMQFVSAVAGANVSAVNCSGTPSLTCTATLTAGLQPGAANGAASFTINASAPYAAGSITNYASIDPSGGNSPPTPGATCLPAASCGSVAATVTLVPNITISKTAPANVLAYSTVPYTIALGNSGHAVSGTTITVTDALPMGMTFVSAVPGTNVASVTCSVTAPLTCTATLNAPLGVASANGAAVFTINTTAPALAGVAINYASVDPLGGPVPPLPGVTCSQPASCSSATTTVQPAQYITLAKAGPASVAKGSAAAYVISLGNIGEASSGTTLTVADALPPGMSFVNATPGTDVSTVMCSGASPLKCTVTLGVALQSNSAKGSASFTINTTAPNTTGTITNYASVDPIGGANPPTPSSTCSPATACGSVQTSVASASTVNLVLDKLAPPNAVQGASYAYTLRLGNSGGVASGKTVTVAEVLPPGVTLNSVSAGSGVLSVSCGALPITGDGATTQTCTVGLKSALAANTTTTSTGAATFTLTASAANLGIVTNYASVDPAGGTTPPSPGPTCTTTSCASAPMVIVSKSASNLTLVKSGTANVGVNTPFTYSFSLGNSGATVSGTSATVADVVPAGVTITGVSPAVGESGINCGTMPFVGDGRSPMTCTVTLGAPIAPGTANGSPVATLNAIAAATGKLTNYASIDSTGATHAPAPGPNCASTTACSSWTTQVHASGPGAAPPSSTAPTEVKAAQPRTVPVPIDARWALFALVLLVLSGALAARGRRR